eukprot:2567475-Alexandrium_andersonii.AAC.1
MLRQSRTAALRGGGRDRLRWLVVLGSVVLAFELAAFRPSSCGPPRSALRTGTSACLMDCFGPACHDAGTIDVG